MKIKRYTLFIVIPCLILVLIAAWAIRPAGAKAAPTSLSCSWQVVSVPNAGGGTHLSDMAALSSSDIWSVGSYLMNGGSTTHTLIENWNGYQWSIVPHSRDIGNDGLSGVAAVSATDVWAVGDALISYPFHYKALIEHWDGTQWSLVHSPSPSPEGGSLASVSAISANDIWAVGTSYKDGRTKYTLAEHWNGTQWSIVPTPDPGIYSNLLTSVVALASNDVWAVGSSIPSAPLAEHWDGTQWSVVNPPLLNKYFSSSFTSVTALSSHNVWAVGWGSNIAQQPQLHPQTFIEHWNGTQWSDVKSYDVLHESNFLSQDAALTATNVWAVGYTQNRVRGGKDTGPEQTLVEHWDGKFWRIISSPDPGQNNYNILNAVTAVPHSSQVWIMGTEGLYYGAPFAAYC